MNFTFNTLIRAFIILVCLTAIVGFAFILAHAK
jgi:hypothetical protein